VEERRCNLDAAQTRSHLVLVLRERVLRLDRTKTNDEHVAVVALRPRDVDHWRLHRNVELHLLHLDLSCSLHGCLSSSVIQTFEAREFDEEGVDTVQRLFEEAELECTDVEAD